MRRTVATWSQNRESFRRGSHQTLSDRRVLPNPRRRLPQAHREENQSRRSKQRKFARHVRPQETINNVVLLRLHSLVRPIDEEARTQSDTGLLLTVPTNNLPCTFHSIVQQPRPLPRRRDSQLHGLRNRRNSIAERLFQRLPVRNRRCG